MQIVDRPSLISRLYKELVRDPGQTAAVTVDMHRNHLDTGVATMPAQPEDANRVIANARVALDFARAMGVPSGDRRSTGYNPTRPMDKTGVSSYNCSRLTLKQ